MIVFIMKSTIIEMKKINETNYYLKKGKKTELKIKIEKKKKI